MFIICIMYALGLQISLRSEKGEDLIQESQHILHRPMSSKCRE